MTEALTGTRVLVTGGASGMGAGIVGAFAAAGASVVSCDIQQDAGADIAARPTPPAPAPPPSSRAT